MGVAITKKSIIDSLMLLLTKFQDTDDNRVDPDYLSYLIDKVRAQLIEKEYIDTEYIHPTWLTDLGVVDFYKVNFADDASVTYCACDISKTTIPQTISLYNGNGNVDLGVYAIMSTCGKTKFYSRPLSTWSMLTCDHSHSKFHYFSRINSALYVNKVVKELRIIAILFNPEDGLLVNSAPVTSGNIQEGVTYLVKYKQIVYNGQIYAPGSTFIGAVTGNTDADNVVTTYSGTGTVYLNSQAVQATLNAPYPVNADMARDIVIEIMTKEFGIERSILPDFKNDSKDQTQIKAS